MSSYFATRQTREAREDASQARAGEKQHLSGCIACMRAARQRRPAERCAEGRRLYDARREADERLRQERELDKMPIPGQGEIFGLKEIGR